MWFNRKLIFCKIKNKLNLSINAQTHTHAFSFNMCVRVCLILHNYIIENGSVGLKKNIHETIKLYTREKCICRLNFTTRF